MTIQEQRDAVVAEARTWIRTPYAHCARVKGAGVDCAMILAEVYGTVLPAFKTVEIPEYSPQWHLHHSDEIYLNIVRQYASEVDSPLPGDIVVVKFGRAFAHGGIVTAWPCLVHAYMQAECVIEEDFNVNHELAGRAHRFFSPWAKTGKVA